MVKLSNPFAFTPGPVTFFTSLAYAALLISLIVIHVNGPAAPPSNLLAKGIDIKEAWRDLQLLTQFYHPYNSRKNDEVRNYLLLRIEEILQGNRVKVSYPDQSSAAAKGTSTADEESEVFVFNDLYSNVTTSGGLPGAGLSVYFEGTNIIVYIRGSEDDKSTWWETPNGSPSSGKGGVMINAHYDSISLGFGATDNGVGVVTVLHLIKYFTSSGHKPKRGLVALLNNGEEDFLNGARAFGAHPLSKLPHVFLNVEGAGAGGRAHMFRATDAEAASAYRKAPNPFSSVISSDGFNSGLVKSQTDYVVFNGNYGMRGLDLAFMEPRARYHSNEDDTRHTSTGSLWHMLSASLATIKELTSDTSDRFDGEPNGKGKVPAGKGHVGVWFDLFGRVFGVARLHTFFALSITLLVVAPIFIFATSLFLIRVDKYYLFSGSRLYHSADGDEEIKLYGWRGFFRFPVIFVASAGVPVALAFLLTKQNPYIIYSSPWAVWAMMVSSWVFVAWFLCCSAYFTRPSALTRVYGYSWLLLLFWAMLVANTAFEHQLNIASGFFIVLYFAALFVVTWLSHLELFGLPKKSRYCHQKMGGRESMAASQILGPDHDEGSPTESNPDGDDDEEANESTSLLRGERRTTFAHYGRTEDRSPSPATSDHEPSRPHKIYDDEQEWSHSLPQWIWILQLIILVPIATIFSAQIGFLLTSATQQTGPDGSSVLVGYLIPAIFTVLMLLPLLPIIHHFTWHIPIFLLLVLIGTIIYNLIAFPFSSNNRLKLGFFQSVDLDSGMNKVSLQGPMPFLEQAILNLPSSTGQATYCEPVPNRESVTKCSWTGIPAKVVPPTQGEIDIPPEESYGSWLSYNITSPSPATTSNLNSARFSLSGKETRACRITFERPISHVRVLDSGPGDKRFAPIPEGGSQTVQLWSRSWDRVWEVDIEWGDVEDEQVPDTGSGMAGKVVCLWSEYNQIGLIPALDEAQHFSPKWAAITKVDPGLVEGFKRFKI